jgi:hypothetical protein
MLLGLRTAIYPVADIAVAKAWYARVVGYAPYFDEPFYVGFNVGGFELGLIPEGETSTAGAQPLWGVTNIEAPTEVGGGIKVAAVEDLFGNRLGLIENPHFDPKAVR